MRTFFVKSKEDTEIGNKTDFKVLSFHFEPRRRDALKCGSM
jgi:hypothetical protein